MGLFSRRHQPDRELADVFATRGVPVQGEVLGVSPEGDRHAISVRFLPEGGREHRRVTIHQRLARSILPGEKVELLYDRENPSVVMIADPGQGT